MIVRLWFRRNGHADGLWWTLEADGVERHASTVTGVGAFSTEVLPGASHDTPLAERRHVVRFDCDRVTWLGTAAVVHSLGAVSVTGSARRSE